MYDYGMKKSLPNGLDLSFTLGYNSNVDHNIILQSVFNSGRFSDFKFPLNLPEWIIGINGFAIQTMNMYTNFALDSDSARSWTSSNYKGEQAPLIAPGYHFQTTCSSQLLGS